MRLTESHQVTYRSLFEFEARPIAPILPKPLSGSPALFDCERGVENDASDQSGRIGWGRLVRELSTKAPAIRQPGAFVP
jgi:hypothetical protein